VEPAVLVAIIDFIYFGEAYVCQQSIDSFLTLAYELNLKGLPRKSNSEQLEGLVTEAIATKLSSKISKPNSENTQSKMSLRTAAVLDTVLTLPNNFNIQNEQELDKKLKSMLIKSTNIVHGRRADICTLCGKEGKGKNIMDHIEENHLDVCLPCNFCDKEFRSRNSLRKHKRTHFHLGDLKVVAKHTLHENPN